MYPTVWLSHCCTDKRYKSEAKVPETVLAHAGSDAVFSPGFSIKGSSIEGRPAYLDVQVSRVALVVAFLSKRCCV